MITFDMNLDNDEIKIAVANHIKLKYGIDINPTNLVTKYESYRVSMTIRNVPVKAHTEIEQPKTQKPVGPPSHGVEV